VSRAFLASAPCREKRKKKGEIFPDSSSMPTVGGIEEKKIREGKLKLLESSWRQRQEKKKKKRRVSS